MDRAPDQIVAAVREAGIIGAGGGGFPAHVKLAARVDTVIANGSECEPLLATDKTLMKERPDLVVDGLRLAMTATGASRGLIAVKGRYRDVVESLEKVLPPDGSIRLHLLENYYPAGDEFLTVYDVTGRVIPEGGIPLDVGVVVNNVLTLAQTAQAVGGKPVTHRPVTVAGEVRSPMVATVPIGTTYTDLLEMAGGATVADPVLMDGGPMMGRFIEDPRSGIAKTTSGVIVLPPDHLIVGIGRKPIGQMVKQSKAACCQCYRCTDLCPRNLIGHEIYPHMTMRTIDYDQAEPTKHVTSAFLCSQCGMCELIACDFMLLSPRKIFAEYRKLLTARGVKNPHRRSGFDVTEQYEDRKVSVAMVMKKLALDRYHGELPVEGRRSVGRVRIPYDSHIGNPAVPVVAHGQKVKMGDLIAASESDGIGARYHASIAGRVTDIAGEWIEICA